MNNDNWDYECAVIGGGPAGLVSGLYLKRFRRRTVLINSGIPRAEWIPKTHNLIGFDHGISGKELLVRLNAQVAAYKLKIISGSATIKKINGGYEIRVGARSLLVKKVILATGIEDVQPDIENLDDLRRQGLLRYCPICDAFEFKGKKLSVLIQDDSGIEKALFLRHFTTKLTIIAPSNFGISAKRARQLREKDIEYVSSGITSVQKSTPRKGIWIHLENQQKVFARAAYVEMGSRVRDEAFRNLAGISRDEQGFLIVTDRQRVSVPGLFAAGDCVSSLNQLGVAAGQAAIAATAVHNDLLKEV